MPLKQFNQQRFAINGVGQHCFQLPVFEHSVMCVCVFDRACDWRACAILHNESLTKLHTSEMRDAER